MMKLPVAILMSAMLLSPVAMAAKLPKIAVVDVRAGVMQSESAKVRMEALKDQFDGEEKEIMALRDEIRAMDERLQKDGAILSQDQKRKLEKDITEKTNEFKFKGQQFQQRTQAEAQDVFKELLPRFEKALKAVVDDNKIELVLHREAALMIVKPEYEITEAVMKRMDKLKD